MNDRRPKVCMFLLNNFAFDSRVEREAFTLAAAGFDITILALRYGALPAYEQRNGVTIKRVGIDTQQLETLPLVIKMLVAPLRLIWFLAGILFGILSKLARPFVSWSQWLLLNLLEAHSSLSKTLGEDEVGLVGRISAAVLRAIGSAGWSVIRLIRAIRKKYREARRTTRAGYRYLAKQILPIWLALAGVSEQADIYHANDMNVLLAAYLAARLTHSRLVYDSHELWIERNVRGGLSPRAKSAIKMVEGFLIRRVDAAMTVNRSIAVELSTMYGVPQPHVVMNCPSYIDFERIRHRRNGHIPRDPNRRVLLYVGRISFNRGLEPLIEAITRLHNVDLVLMGDGNPDYLERLSEHLSELGVMESVHFVDPVPADEVVPTASQADAGMVLFQNTCLSYYYSLPTKLFECIHAGLPVIVSNFPEMAHIVRDYDIGIACDPADPLAIANAVRELFADPVRYEQMRQNTFAAAQVFNWENEGAKLVKIYQSLSADKGELE